MTFGTYCKTKIEDELLILKTVGLSNYPSDIVNKTIKKIIYSFDQPKHRGPVKYPVYLPLPCLGKDAIFLETIIKYTVRNTYSAVKLRIAHFIRKRLNGIYKDVTPDHEKYNLIHHFKFHCDSDYI